jgi:hypothetical protein
VTGTPDDAMESVSPLIRWFVRLFLAAFLACAIFGIELWPLTGFRLFSQLRREHRTMWVTDTVGSDGRESPLWYSTLPRAYQGFGLIMPGFWHLVPSTERATCLAWLNEARRLHPSVRALRIYRVEWRALPRAQERAAPPLPRTLMYACA